MLGPGITSGSSGMTPSATHNKVGRAIPRSPDSGLGDPQRGEVPAWSSAVGVAPREHGSHGLHGGCRARGREDRYGLNQQGGCQGRVIKRETTPSPHTATAPPGQGREERMPRRGGVPNPQIGPSHQRKTFCAGTSGRCTLEAQAAQDVVGTEFLCAGGESPPTCFPNACFSMAVGPLCACGQIKRKFVAGSCFFYC